jgi:hypothetical protein
MQDLLIANYYHAGLDVFAAIVAVVIFISSLDDLFIDIWCCTGYAGAIGSLRPAASQLSEADGHAAAGQI